MRKVLMIWIILIAACIPILHIYSNKVLSERSKKVSELLSPLGLLLAKRYDLIPQLINSVSANAVGDKALMSDITKLRSKATQIFLTDDEKVDLNNKIVPLIARFLDELNSSGFNAGTEVFKHKEVFLENERMINDFKKSYNSAVSEYNDVLKLFPISFFASLMNLKFKKEFDL